MRALAIAACLAALSLAACAGPAKFTVLEGTGPAPRLPPPALALIPTVKIASAQGWSAGAAPLAASGLVVNDFADSLDHPRWLYVLPNGDVLVAESNASPRPDDAQTLKGWVMRRVMKRAGAGVPSPNRITLLRDTDGDGVADLRTIFRAGLNSPFGMALVGETFYVADTDVIRQFGYHTGDTQLAGAGRTLVDLPAGTINHHWTKNVIASLDGRWLYATVGSNSNIAENGLAAEEGRAAILEIDAASGRHRVFASGLRNPNGMAWEPGTGALWTVVNERDEIGGDLVPDYMTPVQDGGFYGWPYSYYGQHLDAQIKPSNPHLVAAAIIPDYALGPHTASLGLAFSRAGALPPSLTQGVFVGQHGSWNRNPRSGYKVIFVPFVQGRPSGPPVDVLTGFLDAKGEAQGRPVGVALDKAGALLVADDVGNRIWRARTPASPSSSRED